MINEREREREGTSKMKGALERDKAFVYEEGLISYTPYHPSQAFGYRIGPRFHSLEHHLALSCTSFFLP